MNRYGTGTSNIELKTPDKTTGHHLYDDAPHLCKHYFMYNIFLMLVLNSPLPIASSL